MINLKPLLLENINNLYFQKADITNGKYKTSRTVLLFSSTCIKFNCSWSIILEYMTYCQNHLPKGIKIES